MKPLKANCSRADGLTSLTYPATLKRSSPPTQIRIRSALNPMDSVRFHVGDDTQPTISFYFSILRDWLSNLLEFTFSLPDEPFGWLTHPPLSTQTLKNFICLWLVSWGCEGRGWQQPGLHAPSGGLQRQGAEL